MSASDSDSEVDMQIYCMQDSSTSVCLQSRVPSEPEFWSENEGIVGNGSTCESDLDGEGDSSQVLTEQVNIYTHARMLNIVSLIYFLYSVVEIIVSSSDEEDSFETTSPASIPHSVFITKCVSALLASII